MSENPDAIRADIEATRARLGTNVDAVADKVTPTNIVQRQKDHVTETVKDAVVGVKEKIMGAADTASSNAHNAAHTGAGHTTNALHNTGQTLHGAKDTAAAKLSDAGTAISHTPDQVKAKAQGNPLAAGLIAFGAGMLVSSLIPPSAKEREAAQQLKTAAEPLLSQVTDAAQTVAQDLKEPAQEAVENVKATATNAAQNVKTEGQDAVTDVKDHATDAKNHVQNT
jgi:gas vesicle protein